MKKLFLAAILILASINLCCADKNEKQTQPIYSVKITGNNVISKSKIKNKINLKKNDFFNTEKAAAAKEILINEYADMGCNDCKVEISSAADNKFRLLVNISIDEGNQVFIKKLNILGNNKISKRKILSQIKSKRGNPLNKIQIIKDTELIKKYYKAAGYVKAEVSAPEIYYTDKYGRANISITINEGKKYFWGNIGFAGNTVYNEEELAAIIKIKPGKKYNEKKVEESVIAIKNMYINKGYAKCTIEPDYLFDESKGLADINLKITENNVIHFGKLIVKGNIRTKENVFSREAMFKEGEVFDGKKINRLNEKIMNLGFIENSNTNFIPTDKPDVMDLGLNIVEGKPGLFILGAGYSSYYGLMGNIQVKHMNLFGKAQVLDLLYEFGTTQNGYGIKWTEPWFLNKPMSFSVSAYELNRARPYNSGSNMTDYAYKEMKTGYTISIGPRINDYLSTLVTYRFENVKLYDWDQLLPSYFTNNNAEAKGTVSSIKAEIISDTRDNIYMPKRGSQKTLSVEYSGSALGGNIEFIKPMLNLSWNFPVFWKFVLSINSTIGFIENYNTRDGSLAYKYFVGGQDTVRGYSYNGISGQNGGNAMAVYNIEYRFPMISDKNKDVMWGAFFFDAGQTWEKAGDFNFEIGDGDKQLKTGIGFGIRFAEATLPFRLDWGYGLNHKQGEALSMFYFTVGNIFQ